MPEGPFGFPRLTSVGPFVSEFGDPEELLDDIKRRPHSYRNYEPQEFIYLIEEGENIREIRPALRRIEDGRFHTMLEKAHRFWFPLDQDEMELYAERNPRLIQWLEVYAKLEEQIAPSENVEVF